jgi:hypothetical protein
VKHHGLLGRTGIGQAFAQHAFGAGMAFAAAGSDLKFVAKLRHGRDAAVHGLADFTIRYVIANTDYHRCLVPLSLWMKTPAMSVLPASVFCFISCFNPAPPV